MKKKRTSFSIALLTVILSLALMACTGCFGGDKKPESPDGVKTEVQSEAQKPSDTGKTVKKDEEKNKEDKPQEDNKAEEPQKAEAAPSCVISGQSYSDISAGMSVGEALPVIAAHIPNLSQYKESTNSKYYMKESGKLLDQGCDILWEFELRPADGYDPDRYYMVRIRENGGQIVSISGIEGWDDPFPSASPNAAAAGIQQDSAPYDLLGYK